MTPGPILIEGTKGRCDCCINYRKTHNNLKRGGGLNAFYWFQIFDLDSAVIEVQEMFRALECTIIFFILYFFFFLGGGGGWGACVHSFSFQKVPPLLLLANHIPGAKRSALSQQVTTRQQCTDAKA